MDVRGCLVECVCVCMCVCVCVCVCGHVLACVCWRAHMYVSACVRQIHAAHATQIKGLNPSPIPELSHSERLTWKASRSDSSPLLSSLIATRPLHVTVLNIVI